LLAFSTWRQAQIITSVHASQSSNSTLKQKMEYKMQYCNALHCFYINNYNNIYYNNVFYKATTSIRLNDINTTFTQKQQQNDYTSSQHAYYQARLE
jgi:hypothetical protein